MTQDEIWKNRWQAVVDFIKVNKRMPSKYDAEERGLYVNWLKHNKKLYNNGELKDERVEKFKELLALADVYRRKNQWV